MVNLGVFIKKISWLDRTVIVIKDVRRDAALDIGDVLDYEECKAGELTVDPSYTKLVGDLGKW